MTTAPVSAPAQIAPSGAAARRRPAPARQRISTAVLVVGTVLSLGSLAGPDWALRMGVVIALLSAAGSCALAWRELYLTKRQHARELLAAGRRHTEDLRAERRHNAEVLDTVGGRAKRWRQEVDRQQTQIAGLRVENGALRGELGSVRRELARADGVITGLRETVRERDVEIALLRPTGDPREAEIHGLPRRVRVDGAEADIANADGAEADVAETGRAETGRAEAGRAEAGRAAATAPAGDSGLASLDLRAESPALPNFEADRRGA